MKIAITIEHFLESRGGAEKYAVGLARAMAKKGHDVHILAYSWYKDCETDFRCHRIPYTQLRTLRDIKFVRATQKEFFKEKFDLCLSFSRSLNTGIYQPHGGIHKAYLEKELQSISTPFLRAAKALYQSFSLRHFLIKKIEKAIFQRQDLIAVAISEMVKKDILSFYSFPEKNIRVIYNGIDLQRFNLDRRSQYRKEIRYRYSVKEHDFLILFVANNFRLKGLKNLVYATSLMKKQMKPGTSFWVFVVGGGKKDYYKGLASRLNTEEKIIFTGKSSEIEKFYAAGDVLVQPTFYDPCSLSTMEAMAAGLAVITTSNNGAGEILINGENGFVLENPQNYEALSKKLILFMNRDLRKKMGLKARRTIENYSIQKNTEKILSLCEEVALSRQKSKSFTLSN